MFTDLQGIAKQRTYQALILARNDSTPSMIQRKEKPPQNASKHDDDGIINLWIALVEDRVCHAHPIRKILDRSECRR